MNKESVYHNGMTLDNFSVTFSKLSTLDNVRGGGETEKYVLQSQ